MFSVQQKREIADAVQRILRNTNHPELPVSEIQFCLHVDGAESWSWADIRNNGAVVNPSVNSWNERQATSLPLPAGEQQHPTPVPVSERLPGAEDCDGEGQCWWWHPRTYERNACWCYSRGNGTEKYWLPHRDLPLPIAANEQPWP